MPANRDDRRSPGEETLLDEEARKRHHLDRRARRLAGGHIASRRSGQRDWLTERLEVQEAVLDRAYQYFAGISEEELIVSTAGEWLLDNFYLVQQAQRQILEDMPDRYYRQLPKLDVRPWPGKPRIFGIALEIIEASDVLLTMDPVRRFIQTYQQVEPLTMGELWALPTMLRLGVLEHLAYAVARITDQEEIDGEPLSYLVTFREDLAEEDVVSAAIRSIRLLATEDWKDFFERVSQVEQVLRTDPADVYARMDFDTRDRYRKVVEKVALATNTREVDVAREAVRLAQRVEDEQRADRSDRSVHVGYYLIDRGQPQLEARLGYRPGWSVRLYRWVFAHPTVVYLGSIALLTFLLLLSFLEYGRQVGADVWQQLLIVLLVAIPALTIAVSLTNWVVTHLVSPRVLPKLDFETGIPGDAATMVVVPALLTSSDEVDALVRQLELHCLRNADPNLHFALLTDFADAPQKEMPDDEKLLSYAIQEIEALNEQYERSAEGPFYLFHRERLWNPGQNVWMGWERKRGKLEEFNALILDGEKTSYVVQVGDVDVLPQIRYVITLDADTTLPRDSAHRLVGTLAHPLNQAQFDPRTGRVVAGYTVLQPRTEVRPTSIAQTLFTRIFTGDVGLDLYTHASSDVYQDLFGEGIYAGKGIYDVAAFSRSLAGRVPENALLSHDLFEGIHGRAGLVSDVVLYEDYPPGYLTYVHRLERWIRGDWQLLPWLFPRVPLEDGTTASNPLTLIDRWKIFDNLRRSLVDPSLLMLLGAGWLGLPGSPLFWTAVVLLTPAVPIVLRILEKIVRGIAEGTSFRTIRTSIQTDGLRWLLLIAFLPHEALVTVDAIVTTLVRLAVTREDLLRWTTAAHAVQLFGMEEDSRAAWQQMGVAFVFTFGLLVLVVELHPAALPVAFPLVIVWLLSPLIAAWIRRPIRRQRDTLSSEQYRQLRRLARRTWLYFEQFVGPDDHWLPPDHFQESPRGLAAHRTSPTNIGLMLLSTLAAADFGYVGLKNLILRLQESFNNMDRLERYRGHFLNWYDTRTLDPLLPRYVSTVDSGNLAACLMTLRQGCVAFPDQPVLRIERWQGLFDTLDVLADVTERLASAAPDEVAALHDHLTHVRDRVPTDEVAAVEWAATVRVLLEEEQPVLERHLVALIDTGAPGLDATALRSLRLWTQRVRHHLLGMRRELQSLCPWLLRLEAAPPLFTEHRVDQAVQDTWYTLLETLTAVPRLKDVPDLCATARSKVHRLEHHLDEMDIDAERRAEARQWCRQLASDLVTASNEVESLLVACQELSERAEDYVQAMDFRFLFDADRQVFHIGYNVDVGALDSNYYDLLASEARIASLVAIAKGDVPQSHWLHLARPVTHIDYKPVLLSWSGTMFEYLMPILVMRQYENTLLEQSDEAAVERQIDYGRERSIPWGISESGFYRFDANLNYQYRAFGVPGLGFKRNLGEDLVVAPYASLLALPVRPQDVVRNLERFIEADMLATYGLYEAVDYTRSRLPLGQPYAIVRSFMAHHQGMILLSLANYLRDDVMVHRFHADPYVQSVELLLQEQIPRSAPVEELPDEPDSLQRMEPHVRVEPWSVPIHAPFPQVHFLSNWRYGVLITAAGSGFSRWHETDLTRWRDDTTLDNWGTWLYVQDEASGDLWSVGYQPTADDAHREVFFSPHKAEFHCQKNDVTVRMELVVSPTDDVEIRRIRITNQSDRPRRLHLTSYGEVVLAPQEADQRHPAFNKLFIVSEYLPGLNALLFTRRPRSPDEDPPHAAHAMVVRPGTTVTGAHETDRRRFLGRGRTPRAPRALAGGTPDLSGTTGATLDPIMALSQTVDLAPHEGTQLAYVTVAADSRRQAVTLVERYKDWGRIDRAVTQARSQSERELQQLDFTVEELARVQQLLAVLLYPHPALRSEPQTLAANEQGQPGLWSFAISGDYPILLVRVEHEEELGVVRELLRAHTYWRHRRLKIDLVILNEKNSGYAQELQAHLHRLLVRTDNDLLLNSRGGIFLLRADQLRESERTLLLTVARAVLDGSQGSLTAQLKGILDQPTRLPAFVPTDSPGDTAEPTQPVARPPDLAFDNGWGGFGADGREYVIYHEPGRWTPAPWINVVANPEFGFLVSNSGLGYSWAVNSGENRLTPWRNDPVSDLPAEALYLRDEETAEVWSPTPLPVGDDAPYLVRHGAGYSVFEHNSHGLEQRVRLFAPPSDPVKIVQVRLQNRWNRVRRITLTYYGEWVLGTDRGTMQQFVVPSYESDHHALLATNPYNVEFGERVAFVAASKEPHGVTADRTEFLGRMGSLRRPAALERVGLGSSVRAGQDPCAAMQLHVVLEPGASEELYFLVGQGADYETAIDLIDAYRRPERVETAWREVLAEWDRLLGTVTVETPDPAMDLMLNRWLLYQDLACRIWGRSALYQSSGAYGFRDQLQDVMAVVHARPDIAREHILRAARHQFEAGDVLHWWHPPSGRGVRTRITDDLVWLPYVTAHYVAVTGDRSILQEHVPFRKGARLEPDEEERYGHYELTDEAYSLYEHCCRAIDKGTTEGPHDLPLMGAGDWNDGMNRVGIEGHGESIWLGWFLYATLDAFAPICELLDYPEQAERYRQRARELRDALETHAWDGNWYLRAYYDDGAPLGSADNRECQIDAIAQSWAVISEAGDADRVERAMAAVDERLISPEERLIRLFTPPFDETRRHPGYIKGYPPGIRENGAQYTHAAIWTVWAVTKLGQGDRAGALFDVLNPIYHSDTPDKVQRYGVEPYVVAADVYSVPPHVGHGGWTWYTGSGGWMYRLGLEAILGFRKRGDTLCIEPCIPSDWSEYRLTCRFGESQYRIHVENPDGVSTGVRRITLDGQMLPEKAVPLRDDGREHVVHVTMGTP